MLMFQIDTGNMFSQSDSKLLEISSFAANTQRRKLDSTSQTIPNTKTQAQHTHTQILRSTIFLISSVEDVEGRCAQLVRGEVGLQCLDSCVDDAHPLTSAGLCDRSY